MGGLHKTIKKVIPKEARSPVDKKIGEENIKTHESLDRRMNPEMPQAEEDEKVIPLPDEEELARQRRRKSRGGGRASTVLTSEDDRLGG